MRFIRTVRSWLRAVLQRSRTERELAHELEFHVERHAEDLTKSGLTRAEAYRRARTAFGAQAAHKEECRAALGLRMVDEAWTDIRYTGRQLRRAPGFTAVAVVSLALGIGANTAIFSLMETVLWEPLPVRDPEQLQLLSWVSGPKLVMNGINGSLDETATGGRTSTSFSYDVFLALEHHNQVLEHVFAFKPIRRVTAVIDGQAEVLDGELVSGQFYQGLGVVPAIGRAIGPADDARFASETVAVISDGLWIRRFGRDLAIVGKRIEINHVPVTIVGVNPSGFSGVETGQTPDIFLPLRFQPAFLPRPGNAVPYLDNPDVWWVLVMGRLRAGVSQSQAQATLDVTMRQAVQASLPARTDRDQPRLELASGARGLDDLKEDFRRMSLVLLSLVGMVLLIACANVANLLLSRSAVRQREVSLRLALGASRWRVLRQLLTEGLSLAAIGGTAGVLFGYWMRDSIPALLATSWRPSPFHGVFSGRVLLLSMATTLATGIVFSLAPAWRSAGVEISAALKNAGHSTLTLSGWLRGKPLVVFQVGLSIVLLMGAGLFVRTLSQLRSAPLGFQPEPILLFTVDLSSSRDAERRKTLFERIEQQVGLIAGVEAVTLSADPLVGQVSSMTRVGRGAQRTDSDEQVWENVVGHRFFETMGIPIIAGRSFRSLDRDGAPTVAVVSQQFARQMFPNENPLGKTFRNGDRLLEIVGIAGDTRFDRVRTPFPPTFYRAYLQEPAGNLGPMTFEVRTLVRDGSVNTAIRNVVRSIDEDVPVFDVRMQMEQIEATFSQERLFGALTTAFAGLALVLACVGIYGVMASGVARRTTEIGIRMALGARRPAVIRMMLGEAIGLVGLGMGMGVLAAVGLVRYVETLLYGVRPIDPTTIGAAMAVMLTVALIASWIPARRASRLEPMAALRHD